MIFRTEVRAPQSLFRLLLMLAVALLVNTGRARAEGDMTLSGGDSGCTDPIFSSFFANTSGPGVGGGGGCLAFPNFSGLGAPSVKVTTAFTHADTFFCSGGNLFAN